jgi:hypothetical protein
VGLGWAILARGVRCVFFVRQLAFFFFSFLGRQGVITSHARGAWGDGGPACWGRGVHTIKTMCIHMLQRGMPWGWVARSHPVALHISLGTVGTDSSRATCLAPVAAAWTCLAHPPHPCARFRTAARVVCARHAAPPCTPTCCFRGLLFPPRPSIKFRCVYPCCDSAVPVLFCPDCPTSPRSPARWPQVLRLPRPAEADAGEARGHTCAWGIGVGRVPVKSACFCFASSSPAPTAAAVPALLALHVDDSVCATCGAACRLALDGLRAASAPRRSTDGTTRPGTSACTRVPSPTPAPCASTLSPPAQHYFAWCCEARACTCGGSRVRCLWRVGGWVTEFQAS